MHYAMSADDAATSADAEEVINGLRRYNRAKVGDSQFAVLRILVTDDAGELIGGLLGSTYWGSLEIGTPWIAEPCRPRRPKS